MHLRLVGRRQNNFQIHLKVIEIGQIYMIDVKRDKMERMKPFLSKIARMQSKHEDDLIHMYVICAIKLERSK